MNGRRETVNETFWGQLRLGLKKTAGVDSPKGHQQRTDAGSFYLLPAANSIFAALVGELTEQALCRR